MNIVNSIMTGFVTLISMIFKPLSLPAEFVSLVDNAFSFLISAIHSAGWIIPLDVLVYCYGAILIVDNFSIFAKIAKWIIDKIIELIPG